MKILITGAQFWNKGAQSLLFSVINELRGRYANIDLYYIPLDNIWQYKTDQYCFSIVYDDKNFWDNRILSKQFIKKYLKCRLNLIKFRLKKSKVLLYKNVIKKIDAVVDVSGFALSDKFPPFASKRYLRYINDAKKYGATVILMPQSFGPFNYRRERTLLYKKIQETLPKADLIFAREKEGKEFLERQFNIRNVELSTDTVLQTSLICRDNVFIGTKPEQVPNIKTSRNVGIIPNTQTIVHGNETTVLSLYNHIISKLINLGKQIYIFRHSNDLPLCEKIYKMFENNENVHLIRQEMDCIEYSEFIKNFDYIIASRYHAIVHAYKAYIPAIILGWAVKYIELAENFEQKSYVFDVKACDTNVLIESIGRMDISYKKESQKIKLILSKMSDHTCFDKCWILLDRVNKA